MNRSICAAGGMRTPMPSLMLSKMNMHNLYKDKIRTIELTGPEEDDEQQQVNTMPDEGLFTRRSAELFDGQFRGVEPGQGQLPAA
ncbi:MAG: hypothetical protein MZV63_21235 [Marinilabiliales bacterium]|nr:hypothetical protein [Marinilabiliales bacterium]